MKTAREIIAEQVCAEVNDVSFGELPETATYLERKTHVARPFLDKGEARSSADAILAALAAEGFSIVETAAQKVEDDALVRMCIEETIKALGDDPTEPISDAGHTVFDLVAYQVRRSLSRPTREGKTE